MTEQWIHRANLGAQLWADNRLLNLGTAYITNTSKLYYQEDDRLDASKVAYASPFKSWVYDSGVDGAYIPHSISGSLGVLTEGMYGMQFDYENGRILLNASVGHNAQLTGTYSFKEFNIYPSNDGQEALLFENKYYLNSRFGRPETGIMPYDVVTPCIFVNVSQTQNKGFALGGLKDSRPILSMSILAENEYQLDGIIGIFSDASEKSFPSLPAIMDPIGPSGNLKSGYDYSVICENAPQNDLIFIESVRGSKFNDQVRASEGLYVGLIEMQLSAPRTTS